MTCILVNNPDTDLEQGIVQLVTWTDFAAWINNV